MNSISVQFTISHLKYAQVLNFLVFSKYHVYKRNVSLMSAAAVAEPFNHHNCHCEQKVSSVNCSWMRGNGFMF